MKQNSDKNKDSIKTFIIKNKNFFVMGIIFVVMIFAIVSFSSKSRQNNETVETGEGSVITVDEVTAEDIEESAEAEETDTLEADAYPEVNELINQYFDAVSKGDMDALGQIVDTLDEQEQTQIEQKREYIESYNNIVCYTKIGSEEGSYIVFVYYEIKFMNIDTLVPGLIPLYVCTNDDGNLYIFNGDLEQEVESYIATIADSDDVKDLLTSVDTKYQEAQANDPDLKAFVEQLSSAATDDTTSEETADTKSEEEQNTEDAEKAQSEQTEEQAENTSDDTEEAESKEEQASGDEYEEVNETVFASETVNVRASASEESDRLGAIYMGESATRIGVGSNGWSKISYNGQEGYVMSQYLTTDGAVTESMSVLETIVIRADASEDSQRLGVIYQGTQVTRTANYDNGWSRIIYDGTVGYVKTEYLETSASQTSASASSESMYVQETVVIRADASEDSKRIGLIYEGSKVTIVGKYESGWSKITYDGVTGYVSTNYLGDTYN